MKGAGQVAQRTTSVYKAPSLQTGLHSAQACGFGRLGFGRSAAVGASTCACTVVTLSLASAFGSRAVLGAGSCWAFALYCICIRLTIYKCLLPSHYPKLK